MALDCGVDRLAGHPLFDVRVVRDGPKGDMRNPFIYKAVPDVISWTPTSLGAGSYRYDAKFNYITTRSDTDSYSGKIAGFDLSSHSRLDSIQIKSSGVVVRKYRFTYDTSAVTTLSRLVSAKECADDAESNHLCVPDRSRRRHRWHGRRALRQQQRHQDGPLRHQRRRQG